MLQYYFSFENINDFYLLLNGSNSILIKPSLLPAPNITAGPCWLTFVLTSFFIIMTVVTSEIATRSWFLKIKRRWRPASAENLLNGVPKFHAIDFELLQVVGEKKQATLLISEKQCYRTNEKPQKCFNFSSKLNCATD